MDHYCPITLSTVGYRTHGAFIITAICHAVGFLDSVCVPDLAYSLAYSPYRLFQIADAGWLALEDRCKLPLLRGLHLCSKHLRPCDWGCWIAPLFHADEHNDSGGDARATLSLQFGEEE